MSSIFNYILISLVAGSAVMGNVVSGPLATGFNSNPGQSPSAQTINLPKPSEYVNTKPEIIQPTYESDPKCSGASIECQTYSFTINPKKETVVSKPCENEGNCLSEPISEVEQPVIKGEPIAKNQSKENTESIVELGTPCEKASKDCNLVLEQQAPGSKHNPSEPKQNDISCEKGVNCKSDIHNGNTYTPDPEKVSNESNPIVPQDIIKSELTCSSPENCSGKLLTAEIPKIAEPELEKNLVNDSKVGEPAQQIKTDEPVQQNKLDNPQTNIKEDQVLIKTEEPKSPVKTNEPTAPVHPVLPSNIQVNSTPHPKQCKTITHKTNSPSYPSVILPKKDTNQNEIIPETQVRDAPELQLQPANKSEKPEATIKHPVDKTEQPTTSIKKPVAKIEQPKVKVEHTIALPGKQVNDIENPEVKIDTKSKTHIPVNKFETSTDSQPIPGTQEPISKVQHHIESLDDIENQEKLISGPENNTDSQPIFEDQIKNEIEPIAKMQHMEKLQNDIESQPGNELYSITGSKPTFEVKNNVKTQKPIAKTQPTTEPKQPSNECQNSSECQQSSTVTNLPSVGTPKAKTESDPKTNIQIETPKNPEPEKIKENETSELPEEKKDPKEEIKDIINEPENNSIVSPTTTPSAQNIIQFFITICKQKIQPLQEKIEQIAIDPHSNTVDKVENSLEKPVKSLQIQFKLFNDFLKVLYKSQPSEAMQLLEKTSEPENAQGSLSELKDFMKNLLGNVPNSKITITIQVCLTPIIKELPQIEKKQLKSVVNKVVDEAKVKCQQQNNSKAAKDLEIVKEKIDSQILKE